VTAHRPRPVVAAIVAAVVALSAAGCSSDSPDSGSDVSVPLGTGPGPTVTAAGTSTTASSAASSPTDPASTATVATSESSTTVTDPAETTTTAPLVQPTSTTPPDPASIAITTVASVDNPVDMVHRAVDGRFYIVSQLGFIVTMRDGVVDDTRVLDISDDIDSGGERGLLGLAFSLDGGRAYVDFTNRDGDTEIVEYAVGPDGVFDPASARLLLQIDQPHPNHNGGQLRIGLDGYLYIGMGDGGSANDPQRRALNVGDLLGKILRIDPTPSGGSPYTIPPDNPFVGVDGARAELWSVGLRNPWRFSFDRITNDLWIADVGQGQWEEIDVAWADQGTGRGANFGWSAFEGSHRFNEDQPESGAIAPIWEYEHGDAGCSVSGGIRYRGTAIPALYGYYVYSDYCSGQVRALEVRDDRTAGTEVVLGTLAGISAVTEGPDGELFVLSVVDGTISAILPAG
jgi:glucose/arabinose dehydrogenase